MLIIVRILSRCLSTVVIAAIDFRFVHHHAACSEKKKLKTENRAGSLSQFNIMQCSIPTLPNYLTNYSTNRCSVHERLLRISQKDTSIDLV